MTPDRYVGTTRPGALGWSRVGITAAAGVVVALVLLVRPVVPGHGVAVAVVALVLFVLAALWTLMRLWTTFVVDDRGVTVSWGGFWTQRSWPLERFRLVQLREVPAGSFGVTLGRVGWRRGQVLAGSPADRRPVPGGRIFTTGHTQDTCRMLVTRPGTMVEVIARSGPHYLFSPEDPQATAVAIDRWIRQR